MELLSRECFQSDLKLKSTSRAGLALEEKQQKPVETPFWSTYIGKARAMARPLQGAWVPSLFHFLVRLTECQCNASTSWYLQLGLWPSTLLLCAPTAERMLAGESGSS